MLVVYVIPSLVERATTEFWVQREISYGVMVRSLVEMLMSQNAQLLSAGCWRWNYCYLNSK